MSLRECIQKFAQCSMPFEKCAGCMEQERQLKDIFLALLPEEKKCYLRHDSASDTPRQFCEVCQKFDFYNQCLKDIKEKFK